MPFGTEVGFGPGHIVLDRNPASSPQKRGHSRPQFLAHVSCDRTAGWIKIRLGMEVGPGHIVLDGDSAPPPPKGHSAPIFFSCLLWPNGWIIKMPLGREVGLGAGDIVLDVTQLPIPQKGTAPQFLVHVYCAKWSPISATAEHFLRLPRVGTDNVSTHICLFVSRWTPKVMGGFSLNLETR